MLTSWDFTLDCMIAALKKSKVSETRESLDANWPRLRDYYRRMLTLPCVQATAFPDSLFATFIAAYRTHDRSVVF